MKNIIKSYSFLYPSNPNASHKFPEKYDAIYVASNKYSYSKQLSADFIGGKPKCFWPIIIIQWQKYYTTVIVSNGDYFYFKPMKSVCC